MKSESNPDNEQRFDPEYIRDRIINLLRVYPKISPTMLSIAMGPQTPAGVWRPIYNDMVKAGELNVETLQQTSAAGRAMQHTIISLNPEIMGEAEA